MSVVLAAAVVLVVTGWMLQDRRLRTPSDRKALETSFNVKTSGNLSASTPVCTSQKFQEQSFQGYVVRICWGDADHGLLEILKNSRQIYAENGYRFEVGNIGSDKNENRLIAMGNDITGNGKPDLVVSGYSGGAHCCTTYYIFEIGEEFRKIAQIHTGNAMAHFVDTDGDSNLEFVTYDDTFSYWNTGFASSPMPEVILRFSNGAYRLASDLMSKPALDFAKLEARARSIRDNGEWYIWNKSDLWGVMLDLIYSGHADLAYQFFDMAWLPDAPGKEEFIKDFRTRLSTSPYWPEIKALNSASR